MRDVAVDDDLIFDVGMHRGQDTAYYLAMDYRVIAFEANPDLVEECRSRFELAIEAGMLTIVEGAIADPGKSLVPFYKPLRNEPVDLTSMGSTDPDWLKSKVGRTPIMEIGVPAIDLAACIARFGMPFYLKVDIEGADRLCLEALAVFDVSPRWLSLEAERRRFDLLCAELDLLERLGYDRFMAVPQEIERTALRTESRSGEVVLYSFDPWASGPFGDDLTGEWLSRDAVERIYRHAFRRRRLFERLDRRRSGRILKALTPRLERRYYDTHAKQRA
jgi:FkbM family methyltransferase